MRKKIVAVIGARPQFIKAAAVFHAYRKLRPNFSMVWAHTGQHYDYRLSQIFFEELKLPEPDYNLNAGSGSHAAQTAAMLSRIEGVLIKERPQLMLVFGDTNSTLAGALGAAKLQIPVAHVEAGLRSFDRGMPEEINRIVADRLSNYLFVTEKSGLQNLKMKASLPKIFFSLET